MRRGWTWLLALAAVPAAATCDDVTLGAATVTGEGPFAVHRIRGTGAAICR